MAVAQRGRSEDAASGRDAMRRALYAAGQAGNGASADSGLAPESFEFQSLLGRGAFGEVRRVQWRKTPVAAKCAHPHMPREQKLLFLRELELMMRSRHPNIVQVHRPRAPPQPARRPRRASERNPAPPPSSSGTSTSRSSS